MLLPKKVAHRKVFLAGEPARVPSFAGLEAEAQRVNFLSHLFLLLFFCWLNSFCFSLLGRFLDNFLDARDLD